MKMYIYGCVYTFSYEQLRHQTKGKNFISQSVHGTPSF